MTLLPFLAITQVAAVAALLTRRERLLSLGIGLIGLVAATWAAMSIAPGASTVGGEPLVVGAYARLFLVLGSAAGVLLAVVGYATSWQRNVPAAMLAALGWTGLGLSLPDTGSALAATVVAGLAGVLVTLVPPAGDRGIRVSARELRAVVVAGGLAIAAVAWVDVETAAGVDRPAGPIVGFALLSVAVAIGLRFGAVPFHAWAGRLSQAAPVTALPLLLAWAPAGFALVALAWVSTTVGPFAAPDASTAGTGLATAGASTGSAAVGFGLERGSIVAVALVTLVGGAFAAWIQDEVEHVVGYLIAQDAGFILLAFASGGDAWANARTFILAFAIAKTGLAAWALALTASYRTSRIDDLEGWARRSPLLLAALAGVVVATFGWPGSPAWSARWALAAGVAGDGLGLAILLAGLLTLTSYVRIARIGLRPAGIAVAETASARPRWPILVERGRIPGGRGAIPGGVVLALAEASAGSPSSASVGAPPVTSRGSRALPATLADRTAEAGAFLRPLWRLNRLAAATALALVLAAMALATAGGAFGLVAAAREPAPPRPAIVVSPTPTPSPAPSPEPSASGSPGASVAPTASGATSPEASGSSAPSLSSSGPSASASSAPSPSTAATPSPTPSATPAAAHHTYTVKSGDNLYAIAQRLGTTVAAILELNPTLKKDPTKLVVGQLIVVP